MLCLIYRIVSFPITKLNEKISISDIVTLFLSLIIIVCLGILLELKSPITFTSDKISAEEVLAQITEDLNIGYCLENGLFYHTIDCEKIVTAKSDYKYILIDTASEKGYSKCPLCW